jgi:serine/threonine-protein kinase PknK
MLTLIVELQGRRQSFVFQGEVVTIGRNEDNDLRLGSRFVSQHHCRLQQVGKEWKIVDLSSQNGTRVNGAEITQKILKHGDRLEVGHVPIWIGEAPEEVTEVLQPDVDEVTPAGLEDVTVSARTDGGARGVLAEQLSRILVEFRKTFGDERGIIEVEKAVESITRRIFPRPAFAAPADAAKLVEIVKAINGELNLKRCLVLIMDSVIALTAAERGFLILYDDKRAMKVKVARNFDNESVHKPDYKFSRGVAEDVGKTGQAIISTSAQDDQRFEGFHSVEALKLRSILCVPFRVRERVIGTLYLDHRFKKGVFTSRERDLVETFADQAAIAIENARLYEENKKTQEELEKRRREIDDLNTILKAKLKQKDIEVSSMRSFAPQKRDFQFDYSFIIGQSPKIMLILQLLERVIQSEVPVLISGESGTGKELIAKAIHVNGKRRDKPFVKENCAAIPETLLESELFGYKKGAFTGADRDKTGLFQQAHLGTLFLDEIGEMSLEMQKKMLRVLQEGEIRPVGARETLKVDVRLVSASNKDLKKGAENGTFREDLYYRLNVINIVMPPLRDRLEDVPLLVEHFLKSYSQKSGEPLKSIDDQATDLLLRYHWPGNVRELENEIQRACAIGGQIITAEDFSRDITMMMPEAGQDAGASKDGAWRNIVKMTAQQKEREIILRALEQAQWKKSAAAKALGISRPTLDGKIRTFGLGLYLKRGRIRRDLGV